MSKRLNTKFLVTLLSATLVLGVVPATRNASTGEIGARTVELLEAAYRSAAERRVVSIDELYTGE